MNARARSKASSQSLEIDFTSFAMTCLESAILLSGSLYHLYALRAVLFADFDLVISFQFTLGDDPSKMLGGHGFQTSVYTKGEMAVLS